MARLESCITIFVRARQSAKRLAVPALRSSSICTCSAWAAVSRDCVRAPTPFVPRCVGVPRIEDRPSAKSSSLQQGWWTRCAESCLNLSLSWEIAAALRASQHPLLVSPMPLTYSNPPCPPLPKRGETEWWTRCAWSTLHFSFDWHALRGRWISAPLQ